MQAKLDTNFGTDESALAYSEPAAARLWSRETTSLVTSIIPTTTMGIMVMIAMLFSIRWVHAMTVLAFQADLR